MEAEEIWAVVSLIVQISLLSSSVSENRSNALLSSKMTDIMPGMGIWPNLIFA